MKKSIILIIVDCESRNLVYSAVINNVKEEIKSYFGSKNCLEDDPAVPIVAITCEINQEDINALKKIIDKDYIYLTGIIGSEGSQRVHGDIIDLTE